MLFRHRVVGNFIDHQHKAEVRRVAHPPCPVATRPTLINARSLVPRPVPMRPGSPRGIASSRKLMTDPSRAQWLSNLSAGPIHRSRPAPRLTPGTAPVPLEGVSASGILPAGQGSLTTNPPTHLIASDAHQCLPRRASGSISLSFLHYLSDPRDSNHASTSAPTYQSRSCFLAPIGTGEPGRIRPRRRRDPRMLLMPGNHPETNDSAL